MRTSIAERMKKLLTFGVTVNIVAAFFAYSGAGGSPISRSSSPSSGATTIAGTVVDGGAVGVVRQPGRLSSSTSRSLAGRPGELQVCVADTAVCLEIGQSGTFELSGDFVGDVGLHITGPGQDVNVMVDNVQFGETVIVTVSLTGDRGHLVADSRRGGICEHESPTAHLNDEGGRLIEVDETPSALTLTMTTDGICPVAGAD